MNSVQRESSLVIDSNFFHQGAEGNGAAAEFFQVFLPKGIGMIALVDFVILPAFGKVLDGVGVGSFGLFYVQ